MESIVIHLVWCGAILFIARMVHTNFNKFIDSKAPQQTKQVDHSFELNALTQKINKLQGQINNVNLAVGLNPPKE